MYIVEERACGNSRSDYQYFGVFPDKESAESFKQEQEEIFKQLMASDCDRTTMQYQVYPLINA